MIETEILSGRAVDEAMSGYVRSEVEELGKRGILPTLAVVRVGERGDDIYYERAVIKRSEKLGVAVRSKTLPESATTKELVCLLDKLNADEGVHGVLLFRPLPAQIDDDRVRNTLAPAKDIDGITDLSLAGVFAGTAQGYAPCTAQACVEILDFYGISPEGKKIVVVGRSLVVGKPVAMLLLGRNATVTLAHSRTVELPALVKTADIVIACVGRAQMIDASYLSPNQIIIDVGINVSEGGVVVGDVAADEAMGTAQAITPVPGGVGTVTTATLFKHVVQAAALR